MSEKPQMPKLSLKLAPKPEEPKPEVPKPQVAPPPKVPSVTPAAGQPVAQAVPPTLGTPPAPLPPIESNVSAEQTSEAKPVAAPGQSSGGGMLPKILFGIIGVLIGAVLGAGGSYTTLSSKHSAEIQSLEKEVSAAKKETADKVAAEQGKIAAALADMEKKSADALVVRESELRREAEEQIAKKDAEIKAIKASIPDVGSIRKEYEAKMGEMQKEMADALAVAELERKEKERLRHLAQQFQTEVKKYNPNFKPAPQPGQ